MNGMKIPLTLVFAVILQAVGLVWYISKIDSKVETMWQDMQDLTDRMAIEESVKLRLTVEQLQKNMRKLQQQEKTIVKDNRVIKKQHQQIFEMLSDNNQNQQNQKGYSYGG